MNNNKTYIKIWLKNSKTYFEYTNKDQRKTHGIFSVITSVMFAFLKHQYFILFKTFVWILNYTLCCIAFEQWKLIIMKTVMFLLCKIFWFHNDKLLFTFIINKIPEKRNKIWRIPLGEEKECKRISDEVTKQC